MKYSNLNNFSHDEPTRIGVLLVNLGTPSAPTAAALRRYLAEFLSDPRIVEAPRIVWKSVLHGIILRTRPRRSAHAYAKVWQESGSPLLTNTESLVEKIRAALGHDDTLRVDLAMTYGLPSIRDRLDEFQAAAVDRLLVLPLFPQYSATTTAAVFDAISNYYQRQRWVPDLQFIRSYSSDEKYIDALVESIRRFWRERGRGEKLLMSFHGIPREYFLNGDPYHCECHATARRVATRLELNEDEWLVTFQSRFGPKEWLKPYTDETLRELATAGTRRVDVVCPGFAVDCLETLEEIALLNRDEFLNAGGAEYNYIPCLNDDPAQVSQLTALIERRLAPWLMEKDKGSPAEISARSARARKMGASS